MLREAAAGGGDSWLIHDRSALAAIVDGSSGGGVFSGPSTAGRFGGGPAGLGGGLLICGVIKGATRPAPARGGGAAFHGASPTSTTSATSAVSGVITFC